MKKKGVSVPRSFGAVLRIVKEFAENDSSNKIKTVKSDARYPWPAGKASGSRYNTNAQIQTHKFKYMQ